MTKLNLQKYDCDYINYEADFEAPDEALNKLLEQYTDSVESREILFLQDYSRNKIQHIVIAIVIPNIREGKHHFDLQYRVVPEEIEPPTAEVGPPSEVIKALMPIIGKTQFVIHASFLYHPKERISLLPLPMTLGRPYSEEFDEVRGYRLIKKTGDDEIEFSIIVDTPDEIHLTHSLRFTYQGYLDPDTLVGAFETAREISSRFLISRAPSTATRLPAKE